MCVVYRGAALQVTHSSLSPFSEPSCSRGCSASLPWYPTGATREPKHGTQNVSGHFIHGSAAPRVSTDSQSWGTLQPDPSPAIPDAGRGLGGHTLQGSGSGRVTGRQEQKRGEKR